MCFAISMQRKERVVTLTGFRIPVLGCGPPRSLVTPECLLGLSDFVMLVHSVAFHVLEASSTVYVYDSDRRMGSIMC